MSFLRIQIFILIFFNAFPAFALTLTISNRAYPNGGAAFQSSLDIAANAIQTTFNTTVGSATQVNDFLESLGNANAMSGRSYLSPGVVDDSNFFVNAGGSLALSLGAGSSLSKGINTPANQLPPVGVGAQTGITLGASGKMLHLPIPLDPTRTTYSLSFFSTDLSSVIGHGVSLRSTQISAGGSYDLYRPQTWLPGIRFNGIRITSGLSFSKFNVGYQAPMNFSQTDSNSGTVISWNNNVNITADSTVMSLTQEAITGVRFLYLLDLYAGLGLDFNAGSSSITGGSSGPVKGVQNGTTVFTATGTVDGSSASAAPTFADLRFLLGTQVNVGPLAVYFQAQAATGSVYSLNIGAHMLF